MQAMVLTYVGFEAMRKLIQKSAIQLENLVAVSSENETERYHSREAYLIGSVFGQAAIFLICKDIAGLTFQYVTDFLERFKTHTFDFARF